MQEQVVLVDDEDRETGHAAKLEAHRAGLQHRAISVCVFDLAGRMLLQRRAGGKYHSGGLWTNTCCTHPAPKEATLAAAHRRLREELGFDCPLTFMYRTHYRADVGGGLVEDELVSVFVGAYDGAVQPNAEEVDEVSWRSFRDIMTGIEKCPDEFTYWFKFYMRDQGEALFQQGAARQTA
jgi:isopentenyl-diphosphate Delta-isomerase